MKLAKPNWSIQNSSGDIAYTDLVLIAPDVQCYWIKHNCSILEKLCKKSRHWIYVKPFDDQLFMLGVLMLPPLILL